MFITKRKNGFYYYFFNDPATSKRKMVSCGTKLKSEALKFVSGFDPNKTIKSNPVKLVAYLSDLSAEVMKYVNNNLRYSTTLIYKRVLNDMLKVIGNKPLNLITPIDIESYKAARLQLVSPSTVNIDLLTIKAIFNLAIRFNWMSANPAKPIKKIKIDEKEIIAFSDSEIQNILSKIEDDNFKNVVLFGLLTGCRLGEIINIQVKDVNFAEGVISITNKEEYKTKSGRIRQFPISDKLLPLLNSVLRHDRNVYSMFDPKAYIFTNQNGLKFTKDNITKRFKKYLRACFMPERFHFHCLRHTFITNLIKKGVSINYIKELAGHSNISTTMNYIHLSIHELRNAVNRI